MREFVIVISSSDSNGDNGSAAHTRSSSGESADLLGEQSTANQGCVNANSALFDNLAR